MKILKKIVDRLNMFLLNIVVDGGGGLIVLLMVEGQTTIGPTAVGYRNSILKKIQAVKRRPVLGRYKFSILLSHC